uniref:DDE Tnp4 domain-containing protein n=1 Tax=Plectus sambesii TaxID=2011161 RepID=A0A914V5L3_9BILA
MEQTEELLIVLGPFLGSKSRRNMAMPAKDKLLATQRQLACAVHLVTKLINSLLFQSTIKWPESAQERREIGRRFFNLKSKYAMDVAGMPSICGAIDGTLVNFIAPKMDNTQFFDRHGNHSLNCKAVAGRGCELYYVSAKWTGSVSDAACCGTVRCGVSSKWKDGGHFR